MTRYIALASIISVMLGVATMIVVNSVMAGFSTEMQNRIHGILSDMALKSRTLEGFRDPDWHMQQFRQLAGDSIEGMTPTVTVPAMISFQIHGTWITQPVQVIGIDERTQSQVSDFGKYLQHPDNRKRMSFEPRKDGYDLRDHQGGAAGRERPDMAEAGWKYRRQLAELQKLTARQPLAPGEKPAPGAPGGRSFQRGRRLGSDAAGQRPGPTGVRPGQGATSGDRAGIRHDLDPRQKGGRADDAAAGRDVELTFPTAGAPPKAHTSTFTVVDFYESKMSEYDASFVFVPIRELQELRGMIDPSTGAVFANSIQIKTKPGANLNAVRDRLRSGLQSPALRRLHLARRPRAALGSGPDGDRDPQRAVVYDHRRGGVRHPRGVLYDRRGKDPRHRHPQIARRPASAVMGIYLSYGLSLGLAGSGLGLLGGLLFVRHINGVANLLAAITGQPIFDPEIITSIPFPPSSIRRPSPGSSAGQSPSRSWPASCRPCAALLHPVEALRYE